MRRFAIILIMLLASVASADWLGTFDIDEYLGLAITTHRFSSGAAYTSANVQFRIYEESSGTWSTTEVVAANDMDEDFDGVTGLHTDTVQLSAGNGFEVSKSYLVVYTATVDSVAAIATDRFRMRAAPLATATALSTASGYASDAKTAAEKIDTNTELRTLLTGADTPVAKASDVTTAHSTTDGLVNGIDDNPWDDGARILTASTNFNDLSAAQVNAEVDGALNTAIPGAPTADSINERIKTLDDAYTAARAVFLDNIDGHTAQTGDSYAIANSGTYGLSALYDILTHATYGLSAIRNQGDAAWITALDGLEVDITKFLGTAITETTGGRIAGNLSTFWDNDDADTSKTVDDIGGIATIPPRIE